ncbi:hypothetical protein GQ55_2G019700 [Panicum hallii var. hallii]|uniref:MADS-box domain-containing protein n=1 Tax=Panicum hallii var. hallii TaxID=1504633 RepID=A0A2T7EKH6_9POAL|nr:hypothetical protein GQ55_2G019700 [Panicum hallii var. hallii]
MPRRPRRSGISYIESDGDRSGTFNGLFKVAAELSILSGAKVVAVIECESGKMVAFGTPSDGPIIHSFLSGNTPEDPILNDEAQDAELIYLQNELIRLEKLKYVQGRKMSESVACSREIQESSKMAKLIYGNIDDLSVDELDELLRGLSWVDQEIQDRLPHPLKRGHHLKIGGSGDPSSWHSSSSHSQIQLPPRCLPWTSAQHSLKIPRSSWPLPQSSRLQSSLLSSLVSSVPPPPSSAPQVPSSHEFPLLSLSLQMPSPLPQQVDPPYQELNLNPLLPPQNHDDNTHSILQNNKISSFTGGTEGNNNPAAENQFASCHWLSLGPSNDLYYGASESQAADMPGPSGLNQQTCDWLSKTTLGSSSEGQIPGDGNPYSKIGNMGLGHI